MKLFYLLLLFLALLMPAQAAPADKPATAASLDVLRLEPWEKRPLLLESSFGNSSSPKFFRGVLTWDVLYRFGPDQYAGLGFGFLNLGHNSYPAVQISGVGRYYLPTELSGWLELPLSRLYLEARLGLNYRAVPVESRAEHPNSLLSLTPLVGLETRFYSFSTRIAAGLNLGFDQKSVSVEHLLQGGIGLSITFEDYDTSAYAKALEQLNLLPPVPAFRMSYGAGIPEGLGWTAWLLASDWGLGFFKGVVDDSLNPQVGLILRRYLQAQRIGGMAYLEAVLSTSETRAGGLRLGYEYRLASWLHVEASLGGGLLRNSETTLVQPFILGNVGLGLTLPLPLTDLPAGI